MMRCEDVAPINHERLTTTIYRVSNCGGLGTERESREGAPKIREI